MKETPCGASLTLALDGLSTSRILDWPHSTTAGRPVKDFVPLKDLHEFVKCFNLDDRHERTETWSEDDPN